MPIFLESLEDRTLLSGIYSAIAAALYTPTTGPLTAVQGNVSHALNNAESLPFVGKQLGDFGAANSFASIQTPLTNALNLLPDPASDDLIRTTIFNAFSSAGIALNSIDTIADRGESGSGPDQVSVRHPANLGTGGVAIEMQIHLTPTVASATFDTGLPSLPFKVTAKGAVTVAVGIDYELAFQYNATTHQPGLNTSAACRPFPDKARLGP